MFQQAFGKKFEQRMDTRELIEKIIPLYDKYYTLEDLKAVNAFYGSEVTPPARLPAQQSLKFHPSSIMSPDQIQELINQQMQTAVAGAPFWMKALFLLQVLSMMVTVICLPLMVWKLFSLSKPSRGPEQSLPHDARLREIRTR